MTVYSILTSLLPIVVLSFIQDAIYPKKQEKAKLGLLVPIAAVYSIIGVLIIWRNHINIEDFLMEYDLTPYSVIIVNMILVVVFILIKLVVGNYLRKKWTKKELIEMTSAAFYSFAEEYDKWFLQHKWTNFRVFLNAIRWGIVVAAGFFLSFINSRSGESMVTFTFPCSVVIIFNEVYHFINGETQEEYEHSILGDDADSRRAGDYFRLREVFEHILPEPLLSSQTGFELAGNTTPADFVKALSKSEDKLDKLTADYYLADNRYMRSEIDGVKATLGLMHKENVVIHDPFYRDLDMYITLPLFHALVSGKKTVVITGRMSEKEDVKEWITDLLADYTHMPSLWHVDHLGPQTVNCEIGVLGFSDLYDSRVLENNEEFFSMTELVILIEPSAILSTGQIALSILSSEMEKGEEKPIYFVSDRMVDGLVDTLSHLLRAEFTNVVAPPVPHCAYTGITWNATGDYCRQQLFDRQTRYLGNGIELAAIALKNQIPYVTWYGETKVPIRDVSWIAGQNYPVICQYINLPAQQSAISEHIGFKPNLWSAKKEKEQFAIVEDEFNNMFMAMRLYISRGTAQSFVNVLSENYLLRDYMRCNQQMFLANPDAIPSIVPDYAKTDRNTLIKLLLLMKRRPLLENEIIDEFHLVGLDSDSAYTLLNETLCRFTDASVDILDIDTVEIEADELTTDAVNIYSISSEKFRKYFEKTLAEAYYIVEEESGHEDYVDAKLFNHVTQCIMPDQFVTYDGKYYRVKHVSPQTGVVLRRAANLFTERKYYRQIRSYKIGDNSETILSKRSKGDIEFTFMQKDISVTTTGYLEMNDIHDLRMAKVVDFSGDPLVDNFSRSYKNKTLLRVRMPETDEDTRFTLCLLLSELFRSLFPDGYPYIAVTTGHSDEISGVLNQIVYSIDGDLDDECIYIIEDSDIDLGLIGAIERNWDRIMEILGDYLSWHFEKMREPETKDPVQPSYAYEKEKAAAKKQSWFGKMADRLRKLVPNKKEEDISLEYNETQIDVASEIKGIDTNNTSEQVEESNTTADTETLNSDKKNDVEAMSYEDSNEFDVDSIEGYNVSSDTSLEPTEQPVQLKATDQGPEEEGTESSSSSSSISAEADHELASDDDTDIFDETGDSEDDLLFELEFAAQGLLPLPKTRYRRECFLKFGFDDIDKRLKIDSLMKYLRVHGRTNNTLTHARKRDLFAKSELDANAVNRCDFCGRALSGASYELLNDGRVRCNDCSASAITSVDELKDLFRQALDLMEAFYNIKYRVPINVKMADARTVAKGAGMVFRPSTEYAARVLGFAQKNKDNYSLVLENGSPRLAALETVIHEMTHIWQYINWGDNDVITAYDMGDPELTKIASDMVYEGMAVWASIQYLYQIGESHYAAALESEAESRMDVYGFGFVLYRDQYPIKNDSSLLRITPFASFPPVDPERVKELVETIANKA